MQPGTNSGSLSHARRPTTWVPPEVFDASFRDARTISTETVVGDIYLPCLPLLCSTSVHEPGTCAQARKNEMSWGGHVVRASGRKGVRRFKIYWVTPINFRHEAMRVPPIVGDLSEKCCTSTRKLCYDTYGLQDACPLGSGCCETSCYSRSSRCETKRVQLETCRPGESVPFMPQSGGDVATSVKCVERERETERALLPPSLALLWVRPSL